MRRVFLLVGATVLVDTMFFSAITPLLPHYQDELGLSKTSAGVLSGIYAAGTLLAALPAGWLAGRIGGKRTTVIGLTTMSVTSVIFGLAQTVELLDAARFVQGVGGACTWAGGLAWLISVTPNDRRGEMIGGALGAAVFGTLLGPVIGGAATAASPELVFPFVGVIGAVLLAWTVATPDTERVKQSTWSELARALKGADLRLAVWFFTLPALFIGTVDVLVPLRLDDLGAAGVTVGALFVAAAAVESALNPVMGRLSDRLGRVRVLSFGLLAVAATSILLPLPGAVWLLGAALLLAVLALTFFWAPAGALLSDASEASGLDQGFAFGLMNLAWAAGQVAGGAAGGALADLTADALCYGILAALCLLSIPAARARLKTPATVR